MSRTKCATRGRSLRYSAAFCGRSVNTLPSTRSQAPARGCVLQSSHVHRYWQRMRHDPTIAKTGSIAAFGVALSYLASSLCAVLMPPELQGRPDVSPHQFWSRTSPFIGHGWRRASLVSPRCPRSHWSSGPQTGGPFSGRQRELSVGSRSSPGATSWKSRSTAGSSPTTSTRRPPFSKRFRWWLVGSGRPGRLSHVRSHRCLGRHGEPARSPRQAASEPPLRAGLRHGAHLFRRSPRLYLPRSLASRPFLRTRRFSPRAHLVRLARVHPSRARRPTERWSRRGAAVLIDPRWFPLAVMRLGRLVIPREI